MLIEGGRLTGHCIGIFAGIDARIEVTKDGIWREVGNNHYPIPVTLTHKGQQTVRCVVDNLDKFSTLVSRA